MLCLFYLICSGYNISCFVPSYVPGISIHIPVSGSHFRICSGLLVSRPDLRLRGEGYAPAYYHKFMTPSGRGIYSSVPRTRAYCTYLSVLIEIYFADVHAEAHKTLTSLMALLALGMTWFTRQKF